MTRHRPSHSALCAGLLALALPALAAGQAASQLIDLDTTPGEDLPSGVFRLEDLKAAGNKLFFVSNGDGAGFELWVSDGTSAGTEIIRDLCPGNCYEEIELAGPLGDAMLAVVTPPSFRTQLWRSDGTRPGTFQLTPPELDLETSPVLRAFLGRSLYFVGCTQDPDEFQPDCDLWRTDGTAAATQPFHQAPSVISWLQAAGDRLFYAVWDGQRSELWVTDGTTAGTVQLRRFDSRERPSTPAAAGDRLFFLAHEDGTEVWTSDGTAAGTHAVTAFPDARPLVPGPWLQPVGSRIYFVADDGVHGRELWRSDGTLQGTTRTTEIVNPAPFADGLPTFFAPAGAAGDILVFAATDGLASSPRLWTTRGTPTSTSPLEIRCGGCSLSGELTAAGGKVFFLVETGAGRELWVTDGTAAGSRKAGELCTECSPRGTLHPWQNGVLLLLDTFEAERGTQLWWSDGTSAGTGPFVRTDGARATESVLQVGGATFVFTSQEDGLWVRDAAGAARPVRAFPQSGPTARPRRLAAVGNRLVFTARDGERFDLWSSTGTPEGTLPLGRPAVSWGDATEPVAAAGLLFFQVGGEFGENDLWRTNGTPQGTFPVAHLERRAAATPYRGVFYFFNGRTIWKTDGTVGGTVQTGTLPSEVTSVETATGGLAGIFLKTVTFPHKSEFWFTDGTGPGTHPITDLSSGGVNLADPSFTTFGPHGYFSWETGLWKSDGSLTGTAPLAGLPDGVHSTGLHVHQGALYFFTRVVFGVESFSLWRTDGTVPGTVRLASFPYQGSFLEGPPELRPAAGRLFFRADDGVHGSELWATDGTADGTALVRDLFPGPRSSKPTLLTAAGGRLFFAAGDDVHGIELWQSDGTAVGTRLVQDIAPQAASSAPEQLTVVGDALYFTADDGLTGREVWKLPLTGPATCRPSPTRFCLSGGRYAVEAVWRDFQGNRGVGHAVSLTADTGYFWFFDAANVEVILKVLDGRAVTGHGWVFYGALSNVEYTLTVTDTQTGLAHRYSNPRGQLASVADTSAFGPLGANTEQTVASTVSLPSPLILAERRVSQAAVAAGPCAPSSSRLCLGDGRFAIEVAWKAQGTTGVGNAVELTRDTGWFWFFNSSNVEVVLKVLDGTGLNGHHWVFYGALSNVEYTVTVTDTQTGEVNTYRNPAGRLASVADTTAF